MSHIKDTCVQHANYQIRNDFNLISTKTTIDVSEDLANSDSDCDSANVVQF